MGLCQPALYRLRQKIIVNSYYDYFNDMCEENWQKSAIFIEASKQTLLGPSDFISPQSIIDACS